MKKLLLTLALIVSVMVSAFAQAPQKFSYQAVVRDAGNNLVASHAVGVRISILQGGVTGNAVYIESQTITTNANGLMTVVIGNGTTLSGDIAAIDWANGPYFLKTETDPDGGTNYTIEGTQQLLSVPYALYAGSTTNSFSGSYNDLSDLPTIPTVPTNVSAFTNDAGYLTNASLPTNVSYFANDAQYVTQTALGTTLQGYATQADIPTVPTNVSAFTNDAGYITSVSMPTVPTNVSAFTNDAGYVTANQIPAQVNADWNATAGVAQILNKPTIPNVPTTVSSFQNDMNYVTQSVMNVTLSNYATLNSIPTVPNRVSAFQNDAGYLTAATVQQAANIPTVVSAFQNDAGYVTSSQLPTVPTNVSAFTNDAGYLTQATVQEAANIPTQVSAFENDAHYITDVQLQEILNTITTMQSTIDSMNQVIEDLNNQVNPPAPEIGAVTTSPVSDITASTATAGGNVTFDGRSEIIARGVCWSTGAEPTIADNHTTDGTGLGEFTSSVTGLASTTTYYLRAYVTNEVGTAYGEAVSFTTAESAVPMVTTAPYSDLLATSVTCGGNVLSDGGMPITDRGICWSDINPEPTIYNNVIHEGTGTGEFTTTITGLNSSTTYHVRAFATNELGTVYGDVVTFTTIVPVLPTVTTSPVTGILPYTATFHGEVVSIGGAMLSARGFCYGTSHNPTIAGDHTEDGIAGGVFESTVTTLEPTTTYYVRAYATNIVGTVYGEETSFTSSTTPSGVTTNEVTNITQTSASCGGAVTYAGGAAVTAKGLCYGTSEHPTVDDNVVVGGTGVGAFTGELTGLVSNTVYYVRAYATNSVGTNYGEERTFTTLPYLVPTVEAVDATEISYYSFTCGGNVTDSGTYAVSARGICYATTPNPTISNPYIALGNGIGTFSTSLTGLTPNTTYYVRAYAINSVGIAYSEQMTVSTLANTAPVVSTVSVNKDGICSGNVTSNGGVEVTERGFCYGTYPNPTVFDSYVTVGNGDGEFSATLVDLQVGTTYYVKAYAVNSLGTTYGEQQTLTYTPCTGTIRDVENNSYNIVRIGNQCWMKENLRTTKKPNGSTISSGIWAPGSNSVTTYGRLYSWTTMMNGAASSNANPSNVQGICPDGWHVPSDAEWTQLEMAVGMSESDANNTGWRGNIAAKLSGNTGWNSSTTANAAGNLNAPDRNSSGFSALPAGIYISSYNYFGNYANFWSATEGSSTYAYARRLYYSDAGVRRYANAKTTGYSVRCVRD